MFPSLKVKLLLLVLFLLLPTPLKVNAVEEDFLNVLKNNKILV